MKGKEGNMKNTVEDITFWQEITKKQIDCFVKHWIKRNKASPKGYPRKLTLGDFDEQFFSWLNTQYEETNTQAT